VRHSLRGKRPTRIISRSSTKTESSSSPSHRISARESRKKLSIFSGAYENAEASLPPIRNRRNERLVLISFMDFSRAIGDTVRTSATAAPLSCRLAREILAPIRRTTLRGLRKAALTRHARLTIVCASLASAPGGSLSAIEVGPLLVIEPWGAEPTWAKTFDEFAFFDQGDARFQGPGKDEDINTFYWDSVGRIKLFRDNPDPPFSIGYRILTMDVESDNGPLDGQLNDVAISVGGEVAELSDDWTLSLVGGLGTANDGHWSNDDALYGLGTVNFSTELDEHSSLHLGIYFDGNQSLFPDVPLPQAAHLYRPSEDLWLTLGFPNTKIYYVPVERLSISFLYHFVAEVRAVVDYDLVAGFHLFGQYSRSIRSFTLEESNNRRLHYEVDRVASGVRWITDWIDVSMAIGYTLDHSYRVGWDLREEDTFADLSNEIYVSFTLQGGISWPEINF
jgi:hypothetical protein